MEIKLRVNDKFTIIDFCDNEMNFLFSRELKEKIRELILSGHSNLIVNLSKVTYIDSTALGILLSINKMCISRGGEFRICCPNQDLEMIFYLTGVDQFLRIFHTEHEALNFGKLNLISQKEA